jgi:CubicO group peptidase (beta-lactamase class C family)
MSIPVGAGAEYSSAPDLDRYLSTLHGGRLLSAKALAQMCADHGNEYGYGWEVTRVHGHRAIQHTGDINGYGAHVAYFPETGERIIVLCNTQGVNVHAASDSLAAILFDRAPEHRAGRQRSGFHAMQ